jgi:hypothetical protein
MWIMDETPKTSPRDSIADIGAIRRILMTEWDPIGCGVPDDEYDSYIPGIYRLMQGGADAYKLSQHLLHLETASMGMRGNSQRSDRVARSLLELMAQK